MEILGYLAALLIGLSLGLTGAGGSILTVPILVYLFGIDPIQSTAYSLFIVGVVALVGGMESFKSGNVDRPALIYYGIPSVLCIFISRKWLVPRFPPSLSLPGNVELPTDVVILFAFAILMIIAAWRMISSARRAEVKGKELHKTGLIFLGAMIGLVTGILGAGGGFLIIPALIFFGGLPMKKAVGTSLVLISLNALIGFSGDIMEREIDWLLLLSISTLAVLGIFVGMYFKKKVDGQALRAIFGYLVLLVAAWILWQELSPLFR